MAEREGFDSLGDIWKLL